MKKIARRNEESPNSYVECGESIKLEDIKEEIKEEESVEDSPFFTRRLKTLMS